MAGGGHRRISTALFLGHRPLKRPYTVIEALLSIDMDRFRGEEKSLRAYSRIFDRSRDWCRARLREYDEADLDNQTRSATDRPLIDHPSATNRPPTPADSQENTSGVDHPSATNQPLFGHSSTPTLDPDPEPEKKESARSGWLNLLKPPAGEEPSDASRRESEAWLEAELAIIEADAETLALAKKADWEDPRTRNAWIKRRLMAFWKQYLKSDRAYRDTLRRERADEAEARFRAARDAEPLPAAPLAAAAKLLEAP